MALLDADALLALITSLLPPSHSGEADATPMLHSPADALALLVHAIMSRLDFRLVGLGDSDRLPSSSSSRPAGAGADADTRQPSPANRLPPAWNRGAPEAYGFRYRHDQSSLDYLIKLTKMGDRVVVNGLALQGNQTSTLTVPLADYFSTSFFPAQLGGEGSRGSGDQPAAQLRGAFTSPSRCNDLILAFKNTIVVPLVPNLQKEGFQATSNSRSDQQHPSSSQGPRPGSGSGSAQPSQPRPPYFSEPDDPSLPSMPFRNPLVVGDRDLDPLGGALPSLPSPFGGRQGGPSGGFGGGGVPSPFPRGPGGMGIPDTGGGMYVGPNHPMFRDRFQGGGGGGGAGIGGGIVPPGARYDPIGPGGMGMGIPRPGPRGPDVGGPLPQPGTRRDGEPDWDELRPPGNNNGYDNMFM
ncbi:uncharacterized protein PFL1_06566 [Pseudozyma flocculosa PF-1]|uniref:Uncharacterized protein n=2 Tax=Pseudozyma flocculosa TaxID=84751 RepID=A0A5C3F948_9BASI|nr:uncharacterized protein PFL1_06566 [Pseudozyma flocculosa PF-1]EPQ25893.1 hypothetical protein PFL1_06566 [Pseudozyma flocculosa PF-1]SPO40606.1 uncharacterized protein PSFLO_06088 [Pseudozyma flocculosa]